MIPHGLEQATGSEHALAQTELRQASGNFCVYRVGHCDPDEAFDSQCHFHSLKIERVPATDNTLGAFQIREDIALCSPSANLARIMRHSVA
ncbi:hypothetical protein [Pseudomonas sp. Pseusp3]|uniref:hypothetical protein n=1 Tax=unclassified Pseudomonas TaxID=196821 RepID=UPI0039B0E01C